MILAWRGRKRKEWPFHSQSEEESLVSWVNMVSEVSFECLWNRRILEEIQRNEKYWIDIESHHVLSSLAHKRLVDLCRLALLHHVYSWPRMISSSFFEKFFYVLMRLPNLGLHPGRLLNTAPFHLLATWQLHLDISEVSLVQSMQTGIQHSLTLKYTALVSPFIVNSSHLLNCLGQRLRRHMDCSSSCPTSVKIQ